MYISCIDLHVEVRIQRLLPTSSEDRRWECEYRGGGVLLRGRAGK